MRRSVSVQVVAGSVNVVVVCIQRNFLPQRRKGAKKNALGVFAPLRENFLVTKQAIHVLLRIEDHEVVNFLTNAGIADRQI